MTRRVLKLLAALLLGLLLWQALEVLTWRRARNPLPLPAGWKKGAYHLHSTFSDGSGDLAAIARAAAADGLDFVVVTDHGRPNLASVRAGGRRAGVLVVCGSEFSLAAGHLAVVGCRETDFRYPPEAAEAIADVRREGGASFLAHPSDTRIPWTDRLVQGYSGIEIISAYDTARRRFVARLPLFPLQYLIDSDYALTALFRYPAEELAWWDRQLRNAPCSGIYALDAHARLQLPGGLDLRFPSYAALMRIMTVYLRPGAAWDRDGAGAVRDALRDGRFFSCFESLAAANGFDCSFLSAAGRRSEMGERSPDTNGRLVVSTPFPFAVDLRIVHDGRPFLTLRNRRQREIVVPLAAPGSYRVELYVANDRFAALPWVLANPIYLGPPPPAAPAPPAPQPRRPLVELPAGFQVEKNPGSGGAWRATGDGGRFDFDLRRDAAHSDYWVALARRGAVELAGMHGLTFMARSDRRRRFWLQLRAGEKTAERAFQRSFRSDTEWSPVTIPFAAMPRLYGPPLPFPATRAESLFILIDNGIAPPGARGWLELRDIALY